MIDNISVPSGKNNQAHHYTIDEPLYRSCAEESFLIAIEEGLRTFHQIAAISVVMQVIDWGAQLTARTLLKLDWLNSCGIGGIKKSEPLLMGATRTQLYKIPGITQGQAMPTHFNNRGQSGSSGHQGQRWSARLSITKPPTQP